MSAIKMTIRYILFTPFHVLFRDVLIYITNKMNKHTSFALPIIVCAFFVAGIITTYKVITPIENYFFETNLPPIIYVPEINGNQTIVVYQHWHDKKFDEKRVTDYVVGEIIRNTNDQRIVNIYQNMKKDQNISILKNNKNNNIYVFTNSQEHISEITVYSDDGENLNQKEKIVISHPNYRVGYGEYDEKNKKIYLGVIRKRWDEGDFGGEWVDGETVIDLND